MDGLQIQILNVSKVEWTRDKWEIGAGQNEGINWADELTQTPVEVLLPHGTTAAAADSNHFSFLVKDALWMVLGYTSADGSFAVQLRQTFHLFGIGTQSEWSRWDIGKGGWGDHGTDTSKYIWRFGSTKVEATPTLSGDSGSVSILISDQS